MGEAVSFAFSHADLAYSNLGGAGPDTWAPAAIRYVNVGKKYVEGAGTIHFDLEVTASSAYTPYDATLNRISGRFAQINLAANSRVDLQVTVKLSCSSADNCKACDELPTFQQKSHCYGLGCSCVGATVTSVGGCTSEEREAKRRAYSCAAASQTLVLPSSVRAALFAASVPRGVPSLSFPMRASVPARASPHAISLSSRRR